MSRSPITRVGLFAAVTSAIILGSAVQASAHATISSDPVAAGGYGRLSIRIAHGCDGEATDTVSVKIPVGFTSVKGQQLAGWNTESATGAVTPYDHDGETVSEGVTSVTWSGGELPDDQFAEFGLTFKAPDKAGDYPFPIVQSCGDVEVAWIELGMNADGSEPEHPAPTLTVLTKEAAEGLGVSGDHHDSDATQADADTAASTDDSDGEDVAVVALGAVVAGALAGAGTSLIITRKRKTKS